MIKKILLIDGPSHGLTISMAVDVASGYVGHLEIDGYNKSVNINDIDNEKNDYEYWFCDSIDVNDISDRRREIRNALASTNQANAKSDVKFDDNTMKAIAYGVQLALKPKPHDPEQRFKVGDHVVQIVGGPVMTVAGIFPNGSISCKYNYSDNYSVVCHFKSEHLRIATTVTVIDDHVINKHNNENSFHCCKNEIANFTRKAEDFAPLSQDCSAITILWQDGPLSGITSQMRSELDRDIVSQGTYVLESGSYKPSGPIDNNDFQTWHWRPK